MQNEAASPVQRSQIFRYPAEVLVQTAAREIISHARSNLPDLSSIIVLLPNLRAASAMARALCTEAGTKLLILPRITTLDALAQTVPIARELIPDSRRDTLLYNALKEKKWFQRATLWEVCVSLRLLFDEMTSQRIDLPKDFDDFIHQLESAYRLRANQSLQFEARLCHELWYALSKEQGDRIDPVTLYHMQLASLAETAREALFAVGLPLLTPAEQEFFERYAASASVQIFQADGLDDSSGSVSAFLHSVWMSSHTSTTERVTPIDLRTRAFICSVNNEQSPVTGRLKLFGTQSIEQEAQAADTQVRQWLVQGHKRIAVVVFDRLVARRTRALLERAKVLVEDETGWTLSTTSASSVIARWLDLVFDDFYYQDLLDFCKSPFAFSHWEANRRKQAVYRLEQWVRQESVVLGLKHYQQLASAKDNVGDVVALLAMFAEALQKFGRKKRSIPAWLDNLAKSLSILGVISGLERDSAGQALLRVLQRLRDELADDTNVYGLSEWREWLNRQFESANYRDASITSPVTFTYLGAARLREFDAVVMLGCDASRLPDTRSDSLLFNQSVREQLGLPTIKMSLEQTTQDLITLLATTPNVLVTWQSVRDGETNLLSPYFERLQALHQVAFDDDLLDGSLWDACVEMQVRAFAVEPEAEPTVCPEFGLDQELIPTRVSASAYNSLMACPYQFYARHVLGLNEMDEVKEALEKVDYGRHVHDILDRFHRRFPHITGIGLAQLKSALETISDEIFRRAIQTNYLSHAWALRWKKLIPVYIDWQLAREAQGWNWVESELKKNIDLSLDDSRELALYGRLDRVDKYRDGTSYAVLDYKTQSLVTLRKKIKSPGEDVQLPAYAQLLGENVSKASYLSLDAGTASDAAEITDDIDQLGRDVIARLRDLFLDLYGGARVRAQGVDETCQRCEMRVLCRKDYWG